MKIAVLSGKGGTGKTFVSVNLAQTAESALYLDCDVEEPNGHLFLRPEGVQQQAVTKLLPAFVAEKCTGCRRCVDFCRFNALAYIGKSPMVFKDVCHSCGGCALVCPAGAVREEPVEIGCVVLREDLTHGQRVEGFRILGIDEENKADYALFEGTCIGNKRICELEDPFAVQNPLTGHTNKKLSGVRVQITAARDEVFMREIYITKGKNVCEQK